MASVSRLRIFVSVPETDVPGIHVGEGADVFVQAFPNRKFEGAITRTANALDQTTRTLPTEVQVANPNGILLPGMYAQVQIRQKRTSPPILVPGDSLVAGPKGIQVAILVNPTQEVPAGEPEQNGSEGEQQSNNPPKQVHFQFVQVGRDYGAETEVVSGLQGWEYVIVNPGDQVKEGALVRPVVASSAEKGGRKPSAGTSGSGPGGITQGPGEQRHSPTPAQQGKGR